MSQRALALSRFRGLTSQVRDFYDRHPYPPPVDSLDQYRQHWDDPQERAELISACSGQAPNTAKIIPFLVAGCRTSQAAKHAVRWPRAQVTGIDCSATGIRHSERLKKQHHIKNLHLHQLPVERVRELGLSFNQIVCTGVLHHLEDPPAGLIALRDVLKPNGTMQLMVYAPYGRAGIYMLQEFCKRIAISTGDQAVRDLITMLCALPAGHPLQAILTQAPELRSEAALADALLNPQDRA